MKILKIFQENGSVIELQDDDNKDIKTYIKELTSLLELDNIAILGLSDGGVILRPSKIISIVVLEDKTNNVEQVNNIEKSNNNSNEEIITDMD